MTSEMSGWLELLSAFCLFIVSHIVPARPAIRTRLVAALSKPGYIAAYATVSIAMLAWLIVAAARAPYVALWDDTGWARFAPLIAMAPACLLTAFAIAAPNPFSFGGQNNDAFDPDRPGIVGLTRHPLLWALALWSGAHAVANGNLAHALLFGGFAIFAVGGTWSFDQRTRRAMGPQRWDDLAGRTKRAAWLSRLLDQATFFTVRVALAAALYLALIAAHPHLIGVPAWQF